VKLPNADRAVVQPEKVRDYLLSPLHPIGRFKAAVFGSIGFSGEQWRNLQLWLLELSRSGDATPGQESAHGQKFEIRATLVEPNGRTLAIVSVWMVLVGEDFPRFITAFPG
jgi:hypothetical protein